MKIMTFNIGSGRVYPDDLDTFTAKYPAKVIADYSPDVIGLQEVHCGGTWEEQLHMMAQIGGYDFIFFGEAIVADGGPYGNAIMSKYPIKSCEVIQIPDPQDKSEEGYYETRCIIKAVIVAEDEELTFFVSHFGLMQAEKVNAVDTMLDEFKDNLHSTVVMGDFNMEPDDALIKKLCQRLKDADDGKNPYTFPSDKPDRKIDYILTSKDIEVIKSGAYPMIGSDHLAYFIETK